MHLLNKDLRTKKVEPNKDLAKRICLIKTWQLEKLRCPIKT